MRALMYLTRRSLVNNLKKAVQKPSTLIALIFAIGYGIFIVVSLGGLAVSIRMDSVRGLLIIITAWCIYATLGNFMAYSSRKGILFKPAHAHFVFTAPISPKVVLLNSAWMNYVLSVVLWVVLAIGGLTVFQVAPWKVLLLILAGGVMELALEVSVMVFLYTNDRLPEKLMKGIRTFIKVFLIGFTLLVVLYFRKNGMTVGAASAFVDWNVLQMIPVIGWQIAAYRLILLGPTLLNVICSCLYAASVIVSVAAVSRMQCSGGYYEEAAKFADDYAEIKKRQKNGETVFGISGKKRKFRQVRERISAKGAKAIFYRQLLEYKKEKFFIFSKVTLIAVVIAFFLCYTLRDAAMETGVAEFFLLGVIAYMSIVMSGYLGKWENELKNPYLYLIPDTPYCQCGRVHHLYPRRDLLACGACVCGVLHPDLCCAPGGPAVYKGDRPVPGGRDFREDRAGRAEDVCPVRSPGNGSWSSGHCRDLYQYRADLPDPSGVQCDGHRCDGVPGITQV